MSEDGLLERAREVLAEYIPRQLDAPAAEPAAVLVLLHECGGEPCVLFTQRTDQVEHHKGQISFPGGTLSDSDESLLATALRETFEEIGVRPEDVEVIGQLDDILTISNFRVTPYVGILHSESDHPFVLNEEEVAEVVQVPLSHLLDDRNMELEVRQWHGRQVLVPAYTYDGRRIWGATARILRQFLELLA